MFSKGCHNVLNRHALCNKRYIQVTPKLSWPKKLFMTKGLSGQLSLKSRLFSAACLAVIAHRNQFFCLLEPNKSSESKVKLRLSNLNMLIKQRSLSKRIGNSVLNKSKSDIPALFNGPEILSSASKKVKLFGKAFLKTLILMTEVSFYLISLLELI